MRRKNLIPVAGLLLGGIALLFIVHKGEELQAIDGGTMVNVKPRHDVGALSGEWAGMHLTSNATGDHLSRHKYELKVSRDGYLSGVMRDSVGATAFDYRVKGNAYDGRVVLNDQNSDDPTALGIEVYMRAPLTMSRMEGVIVGFNYKGELFTSPILAMRGKMVTVEEFRKFLNSDPRRAGFVAHLDSAINAE